MDTRIPSSSDLKQLTKRIFGEHEAYQLLDIKGFKLPSPYVKLEEEIQKFEVYDTDLWICGFPRSGTTWISEIAWLISHDFDYEGAKQSSFARIPLIDGKFWIGPCSSTRLGLKEIFGPAEDDEGFRCLKSHLPYQLLPQQITNGTKTPKIIYVTRNPLDVCVSHYYLSSNHSLCKGTIDDYCKLFLFDHVMYAPFSKHVLSFWDVRDKPNIMFLTYEEMSKDLTGTIIKVASFLEKSITKEQIEKLEDHVSFENMANNPAVNAKFMNEFFAKLGDKESLPFIRCGQVGGYKAHMSAKYISLFQYYMGQRFQDTGLNMLL